MLHASECWITVYCILYQTLRIEVAGLENTFSQLCGPQSCLKPFTRRQNGHVFGVNAFFFRNKFEYDLVVKKPYMQIKYEKRID